MNNGETKLTSEEVWDKWKNVPLEEKWEILKQENQATADAVIWGYKLILGRNPESSQVVANNCGEYSQDRLSKNMLSCDEFNISYGHSLRLDPEIAKIEKELQKNRNNESISSELLIWQTSDRDKYWPMICETSRTIQEYSRNHPVNQETFIGIKRGVWPWQATHNRIYKLNELVENDYKGWVLYIDADAYICDFKFSFLEYLKDKSKYGLIVTRGADSKSFNNFNAGVFFANLGHPITRYIIKKWKKYYDDHYTDEDYVKADKWHMITCDQAVLQGIVGHPIFEKYIYSQGTSEIFNSDRAKVIKQVLRFVPDSTCYDTLEDRIKNISARVEEVLKKPSNHGHAYIRHMITGNNNAKQVLGILHQQLRICHGSFNDELPEQELFSEFIKNSMVVLEIGANIGRSTLIISSLLNSDSNLVSLECDASTYSRLRDNLLGNNYKPQIINAALSRHRLIQKGWDTKPSEVDESGWRQVPTINLQQIKEQYPIKFNTLVLDCEGAFYYILKDFPEIMDGITTIIIENDFKISDHQRFVDQQLTSLGFRSIFQKSAPWGLIPERFHEVWKKNTL